MTQFWHNNDAIIISCIHWSCIQAKRLFNVVSCVAIVNIGIDNLPNEILKNPNTVDLLVVLFRRIYSIYLEISILNPIPQNSMIDLRLSLQYRGIRLLSMVYKSFSSIINEKITRTAKNNYSYTDEQNGFRVGRSCEEHVFTLSSIIRNRMSQRLSIFVAFVDMGKTYVLLFYKMRKLGFSGIFFRCIRSIYNANKTCININGYITEYFTMQYRVKQDDCLSPTLFNLYINDMVEDIKETCDGVQTEHFKVHCLLYADDITFISGTPEDLQCMLNALYMWCRKWHMKVNLLKSNVHFRPKHVPLSSAIFRYGD